MKADSPLRFFLIVNPFAGLRKGTRVVRHLVSLLKRNGVEVDFHITRHSGHATTLAIEAGSKGYDLVVAVGGDGTVNEVAQGLIGTNTPMGIVPWGSGNGLAYDLSIPSNYRKCARVLLHGHDDPIDVCRFNEQPFVCTAGIGFTAQVAEKMNRSKQRGFLKYVELVIRESILFRPFMVRLKMNDNLVETPVMMVTFANASQFGNNAHIAPQASMSDGLIDVVVVRPFSKILLPLVAFSLFSKRIGSFPFVEFYRVKEISMDSPGCSGFYYDGESGNLTNPSVISIGSQKIRVRN
jgi:YegS/Rv2252/BmrU family lipid kinase